MMSELSSSKLNSHQQQNPVWSWAAGLPKIDLHRHLEGSLRIETLFELAKSHGIDLPADNVAALRPYVQMAEGASDFQSFLGKFDVLRQFYTSRSVIQRITREAIYDAAQDNVLYLELRFNPLALARLQDFDFEDVVAWVMEAADEAQTEAGMRTSLILQIPRIESLDVAHRIVDLAISNFGPLVRGVDLAGDEVTGVPQRFVEPFARAYEAGLNITVHAGEWVGPESVRAAVQYLHPTRIGHGVRSVENSDVIKLLRREKIVLEICPTSNLHTGVVREFSHHPLLDLANLGVRVTLNTDDPGVSAITLTNEYVTAVKRIGMPKAFVYRALRHALDAAFLPADDRAALRAKLTKALTQFPGALDVFESVSA